MDSFEEASAYFKKVLQEHLDNKRDITLFAIAVVGGRLKVVEVYQNDQTRRHNHQCIPNRVEKIKKQVKHSPIGTRFNC